jgi:hypothetical protein
VQETIISDLSVCRPHSRLSRSYRRGTWRLIDYETEAFPGTMVYAGPGMDSDPLTLPLNRTGYHAIHLGVHYPGQFGSAHAHVRVRLTDDPAYTLVAAERPNPKDQGGLPEELSWCYASKRFADHQVSEAFWKVADLTAQDLTISRFNRGGGGYADAFSSLVYVRLVPMSEEQIAEYRREQSSPDTRRLAAMNDGGIFSVLRSREDIWAQLEPYRDSDVGIMMWATSKGENCTYRTRVGRPPPRGTNPFDRFAGLERWDRSLRALEREGVDFMAEVVRAAHATDLRIFTSLRLHGPKPVPVEIEKGSFYERHPEFRCVDRDGRGIAHLSLAFPEVRAFWIALLCEALEYGFDGVHVILCRSWPFVMFEEPVIAHFRESYGRDPRQCPEDDPRFWRTLSIFVTRFAQELKQAVDAVAEKAGRKLEIAYNVNPTVESNLKWGVDVAQLVTEGLVDYLIPHPAFAKNAAAWMEPLVKLVRDTPVKLYPDLYPRRQPSAASLYSARTLYDLGCDGIALWDTYARVARISEWAVMKRLGHVEELKSWQECGRGNDYFRVLDFKWVGDRSGDPRYFQTNG